MLACPPDFLAVTARRCAAVRHGTLAPYGDLLRANALGVVQGMFPLYAAHRGAAALDGEIDDFVRHGAAGEAQFFHLSTDFLRHTLPGLADPVARALLEYEWAQFAVELDPGEVTPPPDRAPSAVAPNPTMKLLALPFELGAGAAPRADQAPFLYAVYRTARHEVTTRPLRALDVDCLRRLELGQRCDTDAVGAAWTADALQTGLLVAHPSSKGTS
jgi:hypothetical protein